MGQISLPEVACDVKVQGIEFLSHLVAVPDTQTRAQAVVDDFDGPGNGIAAPCAIARLDVLLGLHDGNLDPVEQRRY